MNQLRITSEQALEQTKPLIQTFPLANIKQFQYLQAVQHQVAKFFENLSNERSERVKLHTTNRQLEDELAQLCRQVNESLSSLLPVRFTVNPTSSAAFQDYSALDNIQLSRPRLTIILKTTSTTTSQSRLTELPRAPASTQTTPGHSSDIETRVRQLEEEITKARDSRETIASFYRSQFAFIYDRIRALESGGTDTIWRNIASLKLVFDTAKSSARLDNSAKDPSTHYNGHMYHTHPHDYNFIVQFDP